MSPLALLEELRTRGVELERTGDRLRYRAPKGALTPELRAALVQMKADILARLATLARTSDPDVASVRKGHGDPWSPWPATLEGLGSKKLGAIKPCVWCGAGTWVRYAALPTCLACARTWPDRRTPEGAKAHLCGLLDRWAGMDEAVWPEANVRALYEDIMDIFRDHPVEADTWFREWRAAHPEVRLG